MTSADLTALNIERIGQLLPNVLTESVDSSGNLIKAIDFDLLRQELSEHIVDGPQERYQLDWPGKRAASFLANAPIAKTLRPALEESVDFDTTKNIFIEGDNLDALKLLQESYLGKVQMIYIDPPYNTGNDFVYNDDFAEDRGEYLVRSGQVDEAGNRLVVNSEFSGRFHSDWLSMMYPRLLLSRNLLSDDGLLFLSIDENEIANAKKLLELVFGERGQLAELVWKKKKGGGNDSRFVAVEHEYILLFARDKASLPPFFLPMDEEYGKRYKEHDEQGRFFWDTFLRKSGKQYYPITCPDGTVLEFDENGNKLSWLRSQARFEQDLKDGEVRIVQVNGKWSVHFKQRMPEGVKPRSILSEVGTTGDGSQEILDLFGANVFDNPKPTKLIEHLIRMVPRTDGIVLDFFSGSCTTAHAVMAANVADNGSRSFIVVSLPEVTPPNSTASSAGYATISDLGKERIRRSAEQIRTKVGLEAVLHDFGMRVLKVDTTNMVDVLKTPDETSQLELSILEDSVKPDRTGEDLLFQVLLDWGLELTMHIESRNVLDQKVFVVEDGALVACFEPNVKTDLVRELAEMEPLRAVFRDSAFESDSERINAEQLFREISPVTDLKAI